MFLEVIGYCFNGEDDATDPCKEIGILPSSVIGLVKSTGNKVLHMASNGLNLPYNPPVRGEIGVAIGKGSKGLESPKIGSLLP